MKIPTLELALSYVLLEPTHLSSSRPLRSLLQEGHLRLRASHGSFPENSFFAVKTNVSLCRDLYCEGILRKWDLLLFDHALTHTLDHLSSYFNLNENVNDSKISLMAIYSCFMFLTSNSCSPKSFSCAALRMARWRKLRFLLSRMDMSAVLDKSSFTVRHPCLEAARRSGVLLSLSWASTEAPW